MASVSSVPDLCPLPFALALTCGPKPRFLSIGTGGTGGVYYPYGGALARLLTEQIPNLQVTAEVTAASVDNLKLMQVGKVDLAFTLADTVAQAGAGSGPFKATGPIGSIRTLAVLYTNVTHVVVKPASASRPSRTCVVTRSASARRAAARSCWPIGRWPRPDSIRVRTSRATRCR
jgi:TRAP transporter TAXI family solute receptor